MRYSNQVEKQRYLMVEQQLKANGINNTVVLEAMRTVPRHLFIPAYLQHLAYADTALPIGFNQTISQPFIVAFMLESAQLKSSDRVLEIGTGSGYQAAVLSRICSEVFSIEIIEPLAISAENCIRTLGYHNIKIKNSDGNDGWSEAAPFDVILVTAAAAAPPDKLTAQLALNGRMIIPINHYIDQKLLKIHKTSEGLKNEWLIPVKFVPMTDKSQNS